MPTAKVTRRWKAWFDSQHRKDNFPRIQKCPYRIYSPPILPFSHYQAQTVPAQGPHRDTDHSLSLMLCLRMTGAIIPRPNIPTHQAQGQI
jgi:hypothetical protein